MENHIKFMELALKEAQKAYGKKEVPVGAVIVYNNDVIASGYNLRETGKNSLYHAEIMAIDNACKALDRWRLEECSLYVTLEPCPMCAGAIINSRLKQVIFGAKDSKSGCFGSVFNMLDYPFNHYPEVIGGILENDCSGILSSFFGELRLKKKTS